MRTRQLQRVETPGDPCGVGNTTETLEQKQTTSCTPMGQETVKYTPPTNPTFSFIMGQSLSRNSVVRLSDHPIITIGVYRGDKAAKQQQQNSKT